MQHQVFNPRDYPIVMAIDFGTTFSYAALFFFVFATETYWLSCFILFRNKSILCSLVRSFARSFVLFVVRLSVDLSRGSAK